MNALILTGSLIAVLTYFPLWKQIRTGEVEQNLLTWALWAILDLVVAATIIVQGGSFLLPIAYFFGGTITVFLIVKSKGKASWTWFESLIASLTIASMVIWYFSGGKIATVASTSTMCIAGIPQLIDAWKKPYSMPLVAFCTYLLANSLSMAGGSDWSIKERFYPALAAAYCFLVVLFSSRKFWLKSASSSN